MRLLYLCLLITFFTSVSAQTSSTQEQDSVQVTYMSAQDTLIASRHPMGELLFTHVMKPKQTLYSLAKFYGLSLAEIYAYNPHISKHYDVGDVLRIPLPNKALITQVPPEVLLGGLARLYYQVKRGDTFYGLTHRVFNVTTEWINELNPILAIEGLKPGQLLHIGWVPITGFPEEWHEIKGGPYARMNHPLKLEYFRRSANKRITTEKGAASWIKDLEDDSPGFYCLHRTAKINSLVEVYNPLTRQTMYLKVSGRLPQSVYDKTTLIIVSPFTAKALGAVDSRFYVHLKHY